MKRRSGKRHRTEKVDAILTRQICRGKMLKKIARNRENDHVLVSIFEQKLSEKRGQKNYNERFRYRTKPGVYYLRKISILIAPAGVTLF